MQQLLQYERYSMSPGSEKRSGTSSISSGGGNFWVINNNKVLFFGSAH